MTTTARLRESLNAAAEGYRLMPPFYQPSVSPVLPVRQEVDWWWIQISLAEAPWVHCLSPQGPQKASFWCLIPHPASATAGNRAADGQRPPPATQAGKQTGFIEKKKRKLKLQRVCTRLLSPSAMFAYSFCFRLGLWC